MRASEIAVDDGFTLVGKIFGDTICIATRTGEVRRLWGDAPVFQRARFFDEVFGAALRDCSALAAPSSLPGAYGWSASRA